MRLVRAGAPRLLKRRVGLTGRRASGTKEFRVMKLGAFDDIAESLGRSVMITMAPCQEGQDLSCPLAGMTFHFTFVQPVRRDDFACVSTTSTLSGN